MALSFPLKRPPSKHHSSLDGLILPLIDTIFGPFVDGILAFRPLAALGITSGSHFAGRLGVTFASVRCQSSSKIKRPLVYQMMEWTLSPSSIESVVYTSAS